MEEESLAVTIHIDQDIGISVVKDVPVGATIEHIKRLLLLDEDPSGDAKTDSVILALAKPDGSGKGRLLSDAELVTKEMLELVLLTPEEMELLTQDDLAACDADAAVEPVDNSPPLTVAVATPCEFRVMQGTLFKKPGTDPSTSKVIRLNRPIASAIKTTGNTWQGSAGGDWVELDVSTEKPGWLLIEGPGFGICGPLLQMVEKVEDGEEEEKPIVLDLWSAVKKKSLGQICVKPSEKLRLAQWWISLRIDGNYKLQQIWCQMANEKARNSDKFLKAFTPLDKDKTFGSIEIKEGDMLCFCLMTSECNFAEREFSDDEGEENDQF